MKQSWLYSERWVWWWGWCRTAGPCDNYNTECTVSVVVVWHMWLCSLNLFWPVSSFIFSLSLMVLTSSRPTKKHQHFSQLCAVNPEASNSSSQPMTVLWLIKGRVLFKMSIQNVLRLKKHTTDCTSRISYSLETTYQNLFSKPWRKKLQNDMMSDESK